MKVLFKLFIISVVASAPADSHAFPELPFCPAGGPPGWLNHFNYKRDQNIWRHYYRHPLPAYKRSYYYQPGYRYDQPPAYRRAYKRPLNYTSPPYSYDQYRYRAKPSPY